MGLNLPVQFAVKNTGTDTVNAVTVQIGSKSKRFSNLALLPGQSATLVVDYLVPETVADVDYTVTANGDGGAANGVLVLNRPDVGIAETKLLREENKERDIQVTLRNISGIPLAGSGKTVKLAFYGDSAHTQQVEETITIPAANYADIDGGYYTYLNTLKVEDFIDGANEIPDSGISVYARTWIEEADGETADELYPQDNDGSLSFTGLLAKYESLMTMDTFIDQEEDDAYTVNAVVRNNSLQSAELGSITADILDDKNQVLASVELTSGNLTLTGEEKRTLTSEPFTLDGTPVAIVLRSSSNSVLLDAAVNGGVTDTTAISLTQDGKLPAFIPTASKEGYAFQGWYTKPAAVKR